MALLNHNPDNILGRTGAGTLQLRADPTGISFEIHPPNTATGREAVELLKRGDIAGTSFGFVSKRDRWTKNPDGVRSREVTEAQLVEISVVGNPAYADSTAALRSLDKIEADEVAEADKAVADAAAEAAKTAEFEVRRQHALRKMHLRIADAE